MLGTSIIRNHQHKATLIQILTVKSQNYSKTCFIYSDYLVLPETGPKSLSERPGLSDEFHFLLKLCNME